MPKKLFLFVSLTLFLGFVYFSYLVSKETFNQLDFDTTVKLQDHLSRHFDLPFSIFSILGTVEVTGVVWVVSSLWVLFKKQFWAFLGLAFFPISMFFEVFGKLFVYHPEPPHFFYRGVLEGALPKYYIGTNYSYPSGHMTRTTFLLSFLIIYLSLRMKSKIRILFQLGLVGFFIAMFVSRIYLGEHWLSDVIGGSLLGTSLGILSGLAVPKKGLLTQSV